MRNKLQLQCKKKSDYNSLRGQKHDDTTNFILICFVFSLLSLMHGEGL